MASNTSCLFEFMMLMGKLKATRRTGWVQRKVNEPESVADHMYRMATLAFLVDTKSGLNKDKCIKLSLVHDMAECIVGDLTPSDGVSKEIKHQREQSAMQHIRGLVGEEVGTEIYKLWEEYEDQSSKEAKFVKDLDKFDMILQAYEYEQQDQRPGALQGFFDSTAGSFQHPQVKEWVDELYRLRARGQGESRSNPDGADSDNEISTKRAKLK